MGTHESQRAWEEYREGELRRAAPVLARLGFALDDAQVHVGGERYLTAQARDVGGGGRKLVLTGRRTSDNLRVVIKVSSDEAGSREIARERGARALLHKLNFAQRAFHSPEEIAYAEHDGLLVYVTRYIEEEKPFFDHSLDEQFFLALRALEAQEGVHATTSRHAADIREAFGMEGAREYLAAYDSFARAAADAAPAERALGDMLGRGAALLHEHRTLLERYCGFLTHADFIPNNLRVKGGELYLLDYASLHFGNKYESWARFINFMDDHNPDLADMLTRYVRDNRGEDEALSLRLMRLYKLAFLLQYYTRALSQTDGDLHELMRERITLWSGVFEAVLDDRPVPRELVEHYNARKEALRSPEEKARQREMLGQKVRV